MNNFSQIDQSLKGFDTTDAYGYESSRQINQNHLHESLLDTTRNPESFRLTQLEFSNRAHLKSSNLISRKPKTNRSVTQLNQGSPDQTEQHVKAESSYSPTQKQRWPAESQSRDRIQINKKLLHINRVMSKHRISFQDLNYHTKMLENQHTCESLDSDEMTMQVKGENLSPQLAKWEQENEEFQRRTKHRVLKNKAK